MRTKDFSVNLDLCGILFENLPVIENCCRIVEGNNYIMTITSARDGVHMKNSLHYKGCAIDIRSRDMVNPLLVSQKLNSTLGAYFYAFYEKDHIHIEYDKK